MEITKATRFQIIKPLDSTWEEFGKILRDLSYQTTRMANRAIQLYWEYNQFRLQYKAEHNKYPGGPEEKELYGCSFRNHVYRQLRELYPLMASANSSQVNQFAMNRWKNDTKDIIRLQKSVPSFRLGTPVQVANQNYSLNIEEGEKPSFIANFTLLSREAPQSRFKILLDGGDYRKKDLFRKIAGETYKQGVMQIIYNQRKKKWFCIISFTFTKESAPGISPDRVMEVNLAPSENDAFVWKFSFGQKKGSYSANEIIFTERKIEKIKERRKSIQGSNTALGHGRKRHNKAMETMSSTAKNSRDALNHKYSKKLALIAEANKCGVIQITNMSDTIPDNSPLNNWPWRDLVEKTKNKSLEKGIEVIYS